ncbi:MAG: DUF3426 domain-containing protein, partial [Gammaproteobacteria bacterium]|nr:DUF3426 domain-containing protein [Gammaproteobacteria bacterium]
GIIACVTIASLQWIYFDRHHLIKDARYQTVILSMCDYLNCDNRNFKNLNQFSLLERNIFTHPTHKKALLISGSYSNEAPFTQGAPNLKISMFNLQGNPIAQRIFHAEEYLSGNTPKQITSGETIHFKLEVADPNTVAITYEFEFI